MIPIVYKHSPITIQMPLAQVRRLFASPSGSLVLSHVNDAGFWLVKQYFNMTVAETFKTWTAMETILSVVALGFIMLLSLVV